jgi:hypothetical protein
MKHLVILIALLTSLQLNAETTESEIRGSNIFFACEFDLAGTNRCADGTIRVSFGGNGLRCYSCHRGDVNFGLDEERVTRIRPDEPYFAAALSVPGLADYDMLRKGLVLTEKGLRGPSGLVNIKGLCQYDPTDCRQRLGQNQDGGRDLRALIQAAIRQHMTQDIQRREGIDYIPATEQELDDLIAFLISDEFQLIALAQSQP